MELNGLRLCRICDNANLGLELYKIGQKEDCNKLLDQIPQIYELINSGRELEDVGIGTDEEFRAYDVYRRLKAFYNTPEKFEEIMKQLTSVKEAVERIKSNENFPKEEIEKYQNLFIDLGAIFVKDDLPKMRAMEGYGSNVDYFA